MKNKNEDFRILQENMNNHKLNEESNKKYTLNFDLFLTTEAIPNKLGYEIAKFYAAMNWDDAKIKKNLKSITKLIEKGGLEYLKINKQK